jgi:hypothetical protein
MQASVKSCPNTLAMMMVLDFCDFDLVLGHEWYLWSDPEAATLAFHLQFFRPPRSSRYGLATSVKLYPCIVTLRGSIEVNPAGACADWWHHHSRQSQFTPYISKVNLGKETLQN